MSMPLISRPGRHPVARLAVLVGVVAVALAVVLAGIVGAAAIAAGPAGAVTGHERISKHRMTKPFAREKVRRGQVDRDQWHIAHVYEVQLRLQRLGLFDATPNGSFGPITEHAVKRFQRSHDLRATGVVNAHTWEKLIKRSFRGRPRVPDQCKNHGWHACYDRHWHQVNLYHRGTLVNSWLVRGGAVDKQTRVGDYVVFRRDIDHRSAAYDDAPMPYSQFFSGGEALHGSRFMMNPLEGHSHGCVNFYVEDARQLWRLTSSKKLHVHVYGAWD